MSDPHPTMLCLLCGSLIRVNASRMCANCLNREVDITEGIAKSLILFQCKGCLRYLRPPFVHCDWESRELLALCLKKIKGLNKAKVIDAQFIYTEPHSKRVKLKVTIQKEVLHGVVVEGLLYVDFSVHSHHCDDCKRLFTPHLWNSRVQVRQKVDHKRTLLLLEQLIQKHSAHDHCSGIVEEGNGLDFQFMEKPSSEKFAHFVCNLLPAQVQHSKKLISHDEKSAIWKNQYSILVQLCPVCKDDIVFLSKALARTYGTSAGFYVVTKITTIIHLLCPFTLKHVEVTNDKYWKNPFQSVLTRKHISEYLVLSTSFEADEENARKTGEPLANPNKVARRNRPYKAAYMELAKTSDFGKNDDRVTIRSHLGNHLTQMEIAEGYDLSKANFSGDLDSQIDTKNLPAEIVLVRRVVKKKIRPWVMMSLPKQSAGGKIKDAAELLDIETLKQDIEDDPEYLQKHVNMYKNPVLQENHDMEDIEADDEDEMVQLTTLIEGLNIDEVGVNQIV